MAAEAQPGGPFVAQLLGPPGLALEVFRQLLESVGVFIVDPDDPQDLAEVRPDVAVLVQPATEHWAAVRDAGTPLVLVQGQEAAGDTEVVDSVLAGADAVLHCDSDPDTVLAVITEVSRGGSVMEPGQMRLVAGLARAANAQPGVVLSRRETESWRPLPRAGR